MSAHETKPDVAMAATQHAPPFTSWASHVGLSASNLQAAIFAALRKRNGGAVIGDGPRERWALKD